MTTEPRFRNRLTESTTPAILRLNPGDFKVSPYGPEYPDGDLVWCETRAEAELQARYAVIAPRVELQALQAELAAWRDILALRDAPGATMTLGEVALALSELQARAACSAANRTDALLGGRAPQFG